MGLALNELVKIKYVSKWDIQPMSSKQGYKIVLTPGDELIRVLDNSRSDRREVASQAQARIDESSMQSLSTAQDEALELLKKHGVLPGKAGLLVERFGAETVTDTVEYLQSQMSSTKRNHVGNPAGLLIYSLDNALPVPVGFMTGRRRRAAEEAEKVRRTKDQLRVSAELAYGRWVQSKKQEALANRYSKAELQERLTEVVAERTRTDPLFRRVMPADRVEMALNVIQVEINRHLALPSFEEWSMAEDQIRLF